MFKKLKSILEIEEAVEKKEACNVRCNEIIAELKAQLDQFTTLDCLTFLCLLLFPFVLGLVIGFEFHLELMQLMNHTNGMEHSVNYLPKTEI